MLAQLYFIVLALAVLPIVVAVIIVATIVVVAAAVAVAIVVTVITVNELSPKFSKIIEWVVITILTTTSYDTGQKTKLWDATAA